MAQLREGRPRGVAENQRIVVWLRVEEVAAVRSPARHLLDRVLPQVRQRAQPSRHLPELRVLLSLRLEEKLLQRRGDCVSSGCGRVVHNQLPRHWSRDRDHQRARDQGDSKTTSPVVPIHAGPPMAAATWRGHPRSGAKRAIRGLAVSPRDELHVQRRRFGVALSLAPRQQLLEGVRQQLVRRHVLASPEQLAGRHLVEDGGHLVVRRAAVENVPLECVDGALELAVVAAHQSDLMSAHHRDRVGDLDGRVLPLERSSSGG